MERVKCPVFYLGRKFNNIQNQYWVTNKEILAINDDWKKLGNMFMEDIISLKPITIHVSTYNFFLKNHNTRAKW